MKVVIYTFFLLFLTIWTEVSLSNAGFLVPLLFFQMFYLTVVNRWRFSLLVALVACVLVDHLLGYTSLPSVLFTIVVASFWRSIGDCSKVELQFLPISVTLFAGVFILMICTFLKYGGTIPYWDWFVQLFGSVVCIAFLTPFLIRVQDWLATKLKILTYAEVQREEMYSATNK